jgi:hypothetical protein
LKQFQNFKDKQRKAKVGGIFVLLGVKMPQTTLIGRGMLLSNEKGTVCAACGNKKSQLQGAGF